MITTRTAQSDSIMKVVLFSVVSVCGCVCVFINSVNLEPFEICHHKTFMGARYGQS